LNCFGAITGNFLVKVYAPKRFVQIRA